LTEIRDEGAWPRTGCPLWRPWNGRSRVGVAGSPPEFEADIVEQCRRGDRSIGEVARDFDLTETAVREWVKHANIDDGNREGVTNEERCELVELDLRVLQLQAPWSLESSKISASFFWSGDSSPRSAKAPRLDSSPSTIFRVISLSLAKMSTGNGSGQ
jgi:transposase-like protein